MILGHNRFAMNKKTIIGLIVFYATLTYSILLTESLVGSPRPQINKVDPIVKTKF
jgi:hypothetical protein